MTIAVGPTKAHWNYFLALDRDAEQLSRYVEFCEANFDVFSVELAHLLFAASSEVDVVAKLLCQQVAPNLPRENIKDYKAALVPAIAELPETEVYVPRYGLSFQPWSNWAGAQSPLWWRSYNSVKHQRDTHFDQATLKNALNALGALMILTYHYYSRKLAPAAGQNLSPKDTMRELSPASTLIRLHDNFYYGHLLIE